MVEQSKVKEAAAREWPPASNWRLNWIGALRKPARQTSTHERAVTYTLQLFARLAAPLQLSS